MKATTPLTNSISPPALIETEKQAALNDPFKPVDTEELEQRAKEARARLLKAVDALDKKRHALTKPAKVLGAGALPAAVVTGALVAAGSLVAFAVSKRRKRSLLSRVHLVRREPSFASQLARHLGVTVLTIALGEVGKLAVKKLMPAQRERKP